MAYNLQLLSPSSSQSASFNRLFFFSLAPMQSILKTSPSQHLSYLRDEIKLSQNTIFHHQFVTFLKRLSFSIHPHTV